MPDGVRWVGRVLPPAVPGAGALSLIGADGKARTLAGYRHDVG